MEHSATTLGELIRQRGILSEQEINRCIALQQAKAKAGEFVKLGEILVQENLLTPEEVRELLALQNRSIFVCATCQSRFNAPRLDDKTAIVCPRCGSSRVEPELRSLKVEDSLPDSQVAMEFYPQKNKIFGKYEIIGEISRGGMGIVYKARQIMLGRIVALKVLLGGSSADSEDVQRFIIEAKAVSRLSHPNIIPIYEIGVENDIHYFSMAYIRGISLNQIIQKKLRSRDEILQILVTVGHAIQYCHEQGVIHRDLKPSNILIDAEGAPYIIDFGIAKFRWDHSNLTQKGVCMGSPAYMAPEYLRGDTQQLDIQSDIYALGVILYQTLSGQTPYADEDTIKIIHNTMFKAPRPIEKLVKIERDLATICNKAIERNPKQRYASAQQLAQDLEHFLKGEEIMARPRSRLWRAWRLVAKHLLLVYAYFLSILLLVGAVYHYQCRAYYCTAVHKLERQLRQERKTSSQTLLKVAQALVQDRQARQAVAVLSTLLAIAPPHIQARAYYLRYKAYFLLGETQKAQQDLKQALHLQHKQVLHTGRATENLLNFAETEHK